MWWDFDGTLAFRKGLWASAMLTALDGVAPSHGLTLEAIRPHLAHGFLWHESDRLHPELNEPGAWWAHQNAVLQRAFEHAGVAPSVAEAAATEVRSAFIDLRHWSLLSGAIDALTLTRATGLTNLVVSNHVPELPELIGGLGLGALVDGTINSAAVGAEKPHPHIFALARERSDENRPMWMVGDSPTADIAGAAAVGVPGVLVTGHYADGNGLTALDAAQQIVASVM